jgi:hypothetical protein
MIYECDGCGLRGTEEEINDHVQEVSGGLEPKDVRCWGGMLVGSVTWLEFHIYGKHPMAHVIAFVKKAYEGMN